MAISGVSILNDVIGPVMRGPSSSHTAGPFFIGKAVRTLLNAPVVSAQISFDPDGSFAHVYREQRSDIGFIAGLLDMAITDDDFHQAASLADLRSVQVRFEATSLADWTHPNTVRLRAAARDGREVTVVGESIGGGQIRLRQIDGIRLNHRCQRPALLVVTADAASAQKWIEQGRSFAPGSTLELNPNVADESRTSLVVTGSEDSLAAAARHIANMADSKVWSLPAIGLITYHAPAFLLADVRSITETTAQHGWTLADLGVHYEAELLRISCEQAIGHMLEHWRVMKSAVSNGLASPAPGMRFLTASSRQVREAHQAGKLICGGLLAEASAAALAVMEQNSSGGVVCAAPTAGSAGIIPGLLHALQLQRQLNDRAMAEALYAAGVVGVMIATRATFAAEVCACAAETGAAAAMAAAGLVTLQNGTVDQALGAATMCLMNTIGLTCDPVQGAVEIPCHARNLAGVAHALVAADAILGGFRAVLPLDQTIDAMLTVGRSLPSTIRCTSRGGLAATPAARELTPLRIRESDPVA